MQKPLSSVSHSACRCSATIWRLVLSIALTTGACTQTADRLPTNLATPLQTGTSSSLAVDTPHSP
ncbi:MAG: hypothetical protein ACM37W_28500 [Actinomycetota bacterium]